MHEAIVRQPVSGQWAELCYIALYCIQLYYITLRYVMLCCVMLCYVVLCGEHFDILGYTRPGGLREAL